MKKTLKWLFGIGLILALAVVVWERSLPSNDFDEVAVKAYIQTVGPAKFRGDVLKVQELKSSSDRIEKNNWPEVLNKLEPSHVYLDSKGVFIRIMTMGVHEEGVFIPFVDTGEFKQNGDPSFEKQFEGIYFYYAAG